MHNQVREDQAKAVNPMQEILRKQFDELDRKGLVFTTREPNPERIESGLKFLADEGQKWDLAGG